MTELLYNRAKCVEMEEYIHISPERDIYNRT